MARTSKPKPKPAAPKSEARQPDARQPDARQPDELAALAPPVTPADTNTPDAAQATATQSTLGDGDATGAQAEARKADAAPEAPAPDVVKDPDGNPSSTKTLPWPADGAVVRVVEPAKGRWRAGRHFGPTPVEIRASDLTDEELQRIFGDPELVAEVITDF